VEYLFQTARVTDIDRLAALTGRAHRDNRDEGRWDVADVVRHLVHEGDSSRRPGGADTPGAK
jgi:hypothetical protein